MRRRAEQHKQNLTISGYYLDLFYIAGVGALPFLFSEKNTGAFPQPDERFSVLGSQNWPSSHEATPSYSQRPGIPHKEVQLFHYRDVVLLGPSESIILKAFLGGGVED